MQRPVAVFITLATEEGKCKAEEYNELIQLEDFKEFRTFLGGKINV